MSYAIHPYAVSLAKLKKTVGSGDARLLKKVLRDSADAWQEIDELDDGAIPVEQALTRLLMGQPLGDTGGFKYGYALKFLCEYLGSLLDNEHWSGLGWEWIEQVDQALADLGVDAKVFRIDPHLCTRGSPIPLPRIDDFPAIGYLCEAEIAKVVIELAALEDAELEDQDLRDSLQQVRDWLDRCTRSHLDLVCFYH